MGEARRPHHSPYSIAQKGLKMRKPRWQAAHAIMAVTFRNWELPNELCRDPLERSRIPVWQPPRVGLQRVHRTQAASHFPDPGRSRRPAIVPLQVAGPPDAGRLDSHSNSTGYRASACSLRRRPEAFRNWAQSLEPLERHREVVLHSSCRHRERGHAEHQRKTVQRRGRHSRAGHERRDGRSSLPNHRQRERRGNG